MWPSKQEEALDSALIDAALPPAAAAGQNHKIEDPLDDYDEDVDEEDEKSEGSRTSHFLLTTFIVGLAMLCAVFIPSIQTVCVTSAAIVRS